MTFWHSFGYRHINGVENYGGQIEKDTNAVSAAGLQGAP